MRLQELFEDEITEVYTRMNVGLRNYFRKMDQLGDEFDPEIHWSILDFWWYNVSDLGNHQDLNGPEDYEALPEDTKEEFLDWLSSEGQNMDNEEGGTAAHFMLRNQKLLPRQTWLVHFCDEPYAITRDGFTLGTDDMSKLGLTTYRTKDTDGYNFAFIAGSKYSEWAARGERGSGRPKYGRHAVMFRNSGVHAYHHSDGEDQIIFWGPDVDPKSIVPLYNDGGEWSVLDRRTDRPLVKGDFDKVESWVMRNYDQYRSVL